MGLIEKLGLRSKNIMSEQRPSVDKKVDQKAQEDKNPAAAQDMCCGSCGGRGHINRKD